MKKCFNCVYFRKVKILYAKNGSVENSFGVCEKIRDDDLLEGNEPACKDFLEEKYDVWYQ
ncbi:MAG: hypothetical protein GYA62_04135 [Bacteroidales bacterium]|nr:hypothetical protein [Bacteroidales bacterium]